MATAGKDVFVDANILVFTSSSGMLLHRAADDRLNELASAGDRLCINRQVIREFLSTVTRKGVVTPQLTPAQAVSDARAIELRFRLLEEDDVVQNELYTLIQQHQVVGPKVHDANIVATMLAHRVTHLLTHNVADFTRYASRITVIPLV
jgi:predicted nucleic acid-binding protein